MERPSLERMAETVQRIEETMTDRDEKPIAPLGAAVAVGPAIGVRAFPAARRAARTGGDPLMEQVAGGLKGLLKQLLDQGPPAEWGCPPPVENLPASDGAGAAIPSPPSPASGERKKKGLPTDSLS
jgi:hypothetical protein